MLHQERLAAVDAVGVQILEGPGMQSLFKKRAQVLGSNIQYIRHILYGQGLAEVVFDVFEYRLEFVVPQSPRLFILAGVPVQIGQKTVDQSGTVQGLETVGGLKQVQPLFHLGIQILPVADAVNSRPVNFEGFQQVLKMVSAEGEPGDTPGGFKGFVMMGVSREYHDALPGIEIPGGLLFEADTSFSLHHMDPLVVGVSERAGYFLLFIVAADAYQIEGELLFQFREDGKGMIVEPGFHILIV